MPRILFAALAVIILAGVISIVATYTFLPRYIGDSLERYLQEQLALREDPEVKLESDPPPEMLLGKFSEGTVVLNRPYLGGLRPERVTIELDPFDLDVLTSLRSGRFTPRKPLSGDFQAKITEGEVERMVKAGAGDVPISSVDLRQGRVEAGSSVGILEAEVPVTVAGELQLRSGAIVFEPRSLRAMELQVPRRFSKGILANTRFRYPLDGLPYGMEVSGIHVGEKFIMLDGRMRRIPVA